MGKTGTVGIGRILTAIFIVAVFVMPPALPAAAVEHGLMSFQGRLTDNSGNLLGGSGTNHYFRFRIYDAASGGSVLWTSGANGTTAKVTQGVFNVLLGDTSLPNMASLSSALFDEGPRYLAVEVSDISATYPGDFELMSPRQRIGGALTARSVFGGIASVSAFRQNALGDCDGPGDKIVYDVSTSQFVCSTDNVGSGGALIEVAESGGIGLLMSSISFNAAQFDVSFSSPEALIGLDWGPGGPASLSQDETVTGLWTFSNGASVSSRLEVSGTASVSALSINGTAFNPASYLPLAGGTLIGPLTFTTASSSGTLEAAIVKATTLGSDAGLTLAPTSGLIGITGSATVSSNFEVIGYASASKTFGSGLTNCTASNNFLQWNSATGTFSCGAASIGGGGGTSVGTSVDLSLFTNVTSLSFAAAHFDLTYPAGGLVKLDWGAGGPASLSESETVTGLWEFRNGASFSGPLTYNSNSARFVTSDSLDFDEFVDGTMTLDGSLTIASASFTVNWKPYFTSHLIPATHNLYDLGTSALRWRDAWIAPGSLHIGEDGDEARVFYDTGLDYLGVDLTGDSTAEVRFFDTGSASISGGLEIGGDLVPSTDGVYSLGLSPMQWKNIFARNASITSNFEVSGTASVSSLTVGGVTFDPSGTRPASNSLDWDEFVNSMTLDANTTTNLNGNTLAFGGLTLAGSYASVSGIFETGTVKATTLTNSTGTLTINAFTLGGNVNGNSHNLTGLDLLTVDSLRLNNNTLDSTAGGLTLAPFNGLLNITGDASISSNIEVIGYASASKTFGSNLSTCSGTNFLQYNAATGLFSCVSQAISFIASNSLDWDELVNSMTLDANTTTNLNGNTLGFGGLSLEGTNASVSGIFETGTVKATTLTNSTGTLTINGFDLGGDINANSYSINDLGELTVNNLHLNGNTLDSVTGGITLAPFNGLLEITGSATVSQNFEVVGYASATQTFGSGLSSCTASGNVLQWSSVTGTFSCGSVPVFGGLAVREDVAPFFLHVTSLSFAAPHFAISTTGSQAFVRLDWGAGGPASLSENETVTGAWTFSAASNQFSNTLEIKTASISSLTVGGVTLNPNNLRPASNSLDWDEFANSMTLDANTTTALGSNTLTFGGLSLNGTSASVSGNLEVSTKVAIGTNIGSHALTVSGGNGAILSAGSTGVNIIDSFGNGGALSFGNGEAIIGVSNDGDMGGFDPSGTLIFQQSQIAPDNTIDFLFADSDGNWRFALPAPGPARGTYNPRSFIIAGPSTNVASAANCLYWGASNIDCNTGATGADLFVQDDIEVLQTVFAEDFVASGSIAGVNASLSGNFELSGTVSSNLTPTLTNTFTLGTSALNWANVFAQNASVSSLEVSGTASVSSLVINGTAFNPASYLPLAGGILTGPLTFTTASSSGTLEAAIVKATTLGSDAGLTIAPTSGLTDITGSATVSSNFEVIGYASASKTFGSGLTACTAANNFLQWDSVTGKFSCGATAGGGSALAGIEIIESDGTFSTHYGSISFETNAFNVTFPTASSSLVKIDYTTGPASRSIAQTISGAWTFSAASSQFSNTLEIKTASISALSINGTAFNPGNYLPLTGGNLIGPLTGTTASFSGNFELNSDAFRVTSAGTVTNGTWNGTTIGLTYGGTGANLSATGGANQFVRQNSVGGAFTVGALLDADIPDTITVSGYQLLDQTLTALAGTGGINGLLAVTASNTFTPRTLTGTTNQITVTNGDGISGNPTLSIPSLLAITNASLSANLEISGTASVSVLTINGTAFNPASYLPLAGGILTGPLTFTTASSSGTLEAAIVKATTLGSDAGLTIAPTSGLTDITGSATVSSNFEVIGYASASKTFGSNLSTCSGTSFLQYSAATGLFSCVAQANATPFVWKGLSVSGDGGSFTHMGSLTFDAGGFTISKVGSLSTIGIDYTTGPASRSIAQTISGAWTFSAASSQFSNTLEIKTASISALSINGTAFNPGNYQLLDQTLTALAGTGGINGLLAVTASNTFASRTLTAPAAGFTITNPAGIAGNPTFVLANDLAALEALGSTGIAVRTAADTWAQRTLTGTTNQITVTNGDGISGNPTLSIPSLLAITNASVSGTFEVGSDAFRVTSAGTVTNGLWNGTLIGLQYGGTGANLSATGGANQIVRQNSAGGAFTVSALADADIPDTITVSNYLPLAGGNLSGPLTGTTASFSGTFEVGSDAFRVTSAGTVTNGLWNGTALTDAFVANTLTLSSITGPTSLSGTFEVIGLASASQTQGSGLTDCDIAATSKLLWDVTTGKFSCGTDQTGGGSALAGIEIIESGGTFSTHYGSISFDAGAFNVTFPTASSSLVKIDYTTGPASRSIAQTISGLWTFSNGASVSTRLEVSGTASISGTTTLRGLTYTWPSAQGSANTFLKNDGSGGLIWAPGTGGVTKDISLVPEYPGAVMSSISGSCTTCIGSMRSDNDIASPYRNFYKWSTTQAASQSYDIWVKVVLPNDFSSLSSISIEGYRSSTNDRVYLVLFDSANAQSSTTSGKGTSVATTNTTWTYATVAAPAGTYTAGQPVTFRIRMQAGQNQNVRAGTIRLEYTPL